MGGDIAGRDAGLESSGAAGQNAPSSAFSSHTELMRAPCFTAYSSKTPTLRYPNRSWSATLPGRAGSERAAERLFEPHGADARPVLHRLLVEDASLADPEPLGEADAAGVR